MYLIKDLTILLLAVLDHIHSLNMSPAPQVFKDHRSFIWILIESLIESLVWSLMGFYDQLVHGVYKILSPVPTNDFGALVYERGRGYMHDDATERFIRIQVADGSFIYGP
jgi:hypothetical protein